MLVSPQLCPPNSMAYAIASSCRSERSIKKTMSEYESASFPLDLFTVGKLKDIYSVAIRKAFLKAESDLAAQVSV